MQKPRALRSSGLAPRAVESSARRSNGAVDVGLCADRRVREQLTGRGLSELAHLARGCFDGRAVDIEAVVGRNRHGLNLLRLEQLADTHVLGEQPAEA